MEKNLIVYTLILTIIGTALGMSIITSSPTVRGIVNTPIPVPLDPLVELRQQDWTLNARAMKTLTLVNVPRGSSVMQTGPTTLTFIFNHPVPAGEAPAPAPAPVAPVPMSSAPAKR